MRNPLLVERRGHLLVAGFGLPILAVITVLGLGNYTKESLWNQTKGATRPVAKLLYSEIPADAPPTTQEAARETKRNRLCSSLPCQSIDVALQGNHLVRIDDDGEPREERVFHEGERIALQNQK